MGLSNIVVYLATVTEYLIKICVMKSFQIEINVIFFNKIKNNILNCINIYYKINIFINKQKSINSYY